MPRWWALTIVVVCCLWPVTSAVAVDRITIDESHDAELLPYHPVFKQQFALSPLGITIQRPTGVLWRDSTSGAATFIISFNVLKNYDQPASINTRSFPDFSLIDDDPVRMLVRDIGIAYAGDSANVTVLGLGARNDSAFFFSQNPYGVDYRELFLATGEDLTGDGTWSVRPFFLCISDYDQDSSLEAVVSIVAGRDGPPREVISIDIPSFTIDWRLSVIGGVSGRQFICETGNPELPFWIVTGTHAQGFHDETYSDAYGYLLQVDRHGTIAQSAITSRFPIGPSNLLPGPDGSVYLAHTLPYGTTEAAADSVPQSFHLSEISIDGDLTRSVTLPEEVGSIWLQDDDGDGRKEIYTHSMSGSFRVFDSNFQLIAESAPTSLKGFHGLGPPLGEYPFTLILRDAYHSTCVYSPDFRKLAELPPTTYFDTLRLDPVSDSSVLISVNTFDANAVVLSLQQRGWTEYVRIIFNRYQNYFFAVLFALIVGLIIVNFYRVRTQNNLDTIARQKLELERAHEQLREAQQQLIEAAKYKQAQEIAGGFAHEIRNALLPAEISLRKIRSLLSDEPKAVKNAERAIDRALGLVSLISTYTHIEERKTRDRIHLLPVLRAVLDDLAARIQASGVNTDIEMASGMAVDVDREHLRIILTNLIANALDALGESDSGAIQIVATQNDTETRLTVADNGPGIAEEILPRIFDPFISTRPREGHGIGLALVKRIVSVYGGEIAAENQVSGGARFTVRIPMSYTIDE